MMNADQVLEKFRQSGALLEGHFILSSGLHSMVYLQCAIALRSPVVAAEFGAALAEHFRAGQIETVASPAIGGLIIGYEVARHLGADFVWTERANGKMILRRGFSLGEDESVLVVEDVVWAAATTLEITASSNVANIFFIGSLPDLV